MKPPDVKLSPAPNEPIVLRTPVRRVLIASILFLLLALSIFTAYAWFESAYNSFFGCQDDLVEVRRSPTGLYDSVVRKCGCSAQTSKYTLVYITRPHGETGCKPASTLALVNARGEHALTASWVSSRELRVSLNGMRHQYDEGAVTAILQTPSDKATKSQPDDDALSVIVEQRGKRQ